MCLGIFKVSPEYVPGINVHCLDSVEGMSQGYLRGCLGWGMGVAETPIA